MREVPKDVKINCLILKELKNTSVINGKMKICCKCKNEKYLEFFGKLKNSPDGLRYDCKECRKEYNIKNKEMIQEKNKEYYTLNKSNILIKNSEYRILNKEKILEQRQEYRNKEDIKLHIKQKNKEYLPIKKAKIKERRKNDNFFRVSEILRSKFNRAIKRNKYSDFLGCDLQFFKCWIEYRFQSDMNWDNLGKIWHIDHILPINCFDFTNETDIKICFHWTNLQPLYATENISKSNKIYFHHYFNNFISVFRFNSFNKQFMGYQAANESLQWLRKTTSGMVKMPHMNIYLYNKDKYEMDNSQPSH